MQDDLIPQCDICGSLMPDGVCSGFLGHDPVTMPKPSIDEATLDKIALILDTADGYCSHCAMDLARKFDEHIPGVNMVKRLKKVWGEDGNSD